MAAGKLASEGRLSVQNVDLRKLVEFVSPASSGWLDDGAATLSLEFRTAGLKNFSAKIAGSLPSLTLARGSRKALLKTKDFKAIVTGDEKEFRFIVESLPLVSPPLNAAGELTLDRKSSALSVKLTGRDLDVGPIRESVLLLAGDVSSVQNAFRYLQSGTIPELRVEARGRSLADALEPACRSFGKLSWRQDFCSRARSRSGKCQWIVVVHCRGSRVPEMFRDPW